MKWKDRILNLRNEINYTQEEFARKLDVSVFTINRWERGRNDPSRKYQRKIERLENEVGNQKENKI